MPESIKRSNRRDTSANPPYPRGFASCPRGLEELLAEELRAIGISDARPTAGGTAFTYSLRNLYLGCLWSRVASRVMLNMAEVEANDADELLAGVRSLPWEQHLAPGATIAVDFIGTSDTLRNSQYSARLVKDGVVDRLRDISGDRPGVELRDPDLRIIARLYRGKCTVSLDFSGEALHRRGYRQGTGAAPLKENLAAAVLIRAGWPAIAAAGGSLYDPMCGSGTFLIEAAQMAAGIAPGLNRDLAPREWPGHDRALWFRLVDEAQERRAAASALPPIAGADADPRVIDAAAANVTAAGLEDHIRLRVAPLQAVEQPAISAACPGLVICNPPYGERISAREGLHQLYADLGAVIRDRFPAWQAAILTAEGELPDYLGMRWARAYKFRNGAIDCRLLMFQPGAQPKFRPEQEDQRTPDALSESAQMVANRLRKNRRKLKSWLATAGTDCYRVYDADIPEYAVAIDCYGDRIHIAEYAPPATVDAQQARVRLREVKNAVRQVFEVVPSNIVLKTRERQRGQQQYQRQGDTGQMQTVFEAPAKFWVNLEDYLDTGLFLDHRRVRRLLGELAAGKRFLNLFCYTASATVHAALGGATQSLSVDMSSTYLEWAERNFTLNEINLRQHRVLRADCVQWMKEQAERRERWDLIFLDPPSFSNSKRMHATLDIQRDHVALIEDAMRLLSDLGTLVFSTNRRGFRLDHAALSRYQVEDLTAASFDPDFERGRTQHRVFRLRQQPTVAAKA